MHVREEYKVVRVIHSESRIQVDLNQVGNDGGMTLFVTNPAVAEFLKPGRRFTLDFTPVADAGEDLEPFEPGPVS